MTSNNKDKRQQIMLAAERLFLGRPFHEVTTDQVAHEAHVGKGTIYRYFKSKDDLFFETAHRGFDELCELLHREVSPAPRSFSSSSAPAWRSAGFSRNAGSCSA